MPKATINYKLQDYQGHVLFQKGAGGSTITVANLQHITILDVNGKPIYTSAGAAAPSPTPPADAGFDYVKVDARGTSGDATQIELGTAGNDMIAEYGGMGNVTQIISGVPVMIGCSRSVADQTSTQSPPVGDWR